MRTFSATRPDSQSLLRVSSDIVFVDARRGATFDEVNDDCFPTPEQLAADSKRRGDYDFSYGNNGLRCAGFAARGKRRVRRCFNISSPG